MRQLFTGAIIGVALIAAAPASAAAFYVDKSLGDLPVEQKVTVADPQPVQLIIGFETDGKPNPKATQYVKKQVTEEVSTSGVFSPVSEGPAPNGAVLGITINNITEKDAAGKGVAVGLTFGLAGKVIADRYDVTLRLARPGAPEITQKVEHVLYGKIGAASEPANGLRVKNAKEAIALILRQALAHGLNRLAADPAFAGYAPAGAAPVAVPAQPN